MRITDRIKLYFFAILSRFVNGSFRNAVNRFIFSAVLGWIVCFVMDRLDIYKFVFISFPLLSICVKRVSDNCIYFPFLGFLSMNLACPKEYRKYSYKNEKDKISEKFRNEFIKGIEQAFKYWKVVKFDTHKWVVDNVVFNDSIKVNFDIEIKVLGKIRIPTAVLCLFSMKEIMNDEQFAFDCAFREREGYYVILKMGRN